MATIRRFVICFTLFLCKISSSEYATVTWDHTTQKLTLQEGLVTDNWVAKGNFTNETNETGWAYLDVSTNEDYADSMQAYAAGLVEGHLTKEMISLHLINTVYGYCDEHRPRVFDKYCSQLEDFLRKNIEWIQDMIKTNPTDIYWQQVARFYNQFAGLEDGYNSVIDKPRVNVTNFFTLYLIQISGDVEDLEAVFKKPPTPNSRVLGSGSCSALVKVLPGNKDLYVSQDTWSTYQSMLRILKKYNFPFHQDEERVSGYMMTFSSYPGSLMSGDDYYLLSSGMVAMETTIGNSNNDLWSHIAPTTTLEGIRSLVANRLATSGLQWCTYFSRYNSGTYNNQWMIVDYKKFVPGKQMKEFDGVLWVLEQLPGEIQYGELSGVLQKQGYWPSYNVAYFPKIFNDSGMATLVEKYGDWFSYNHTARANIFRRDHSKVVDIESMLKLMRYNDYVHDPLSQCKCNPPYSAENAISARCDLNPANGTYSIAALGHRAHGGTDSKITGKDMFKAMQFLSVAGPTHDQQPPFQWSKSDFRDTYPHAGHPDLFNFDPIIHKWNLDF